MSNKPVEAFRESLHNSVEMDDLKKVNAAMQEMNKEIIKEFPLEMRVNCILGLISQAKERYGDEFKLNVEVTNELLHANIGPYDFNIIPEIKTVEDIIELRETICLAIIQDGYWRKRYCKKCKETFYLTFGEVNFYAEKKFPLPKQCTYCKKGIEKPKPVATKKVEQVEEEPMPTAMEIALKNAGLK